MDSIILWILSSLMPSIVVHRQSYCLCLHICFYMQANRTLDCTDSDIIFETCKIHSLTFPSNYLILGLDFSMPLAPSFHIVLVNKLLPFAMWTSLTSQTTMGAVWPCPLPGLGHPQLVFMELAFRVVGTDFRHLPAVLRLSFHEYRLLS